MSCCKCAYCPKVYNATTGEWSCEPPGPVDAGLVERRNDFAHYIDSLDCSGCLGGNMDLSFNGRPVAGFGVGDDFGLSHALAAAPDVCPSWGDVDTHFADDVRCFQGWFNAYTKGQGVVPLNATGIFDEQTLCALQFVMMQLKQVAFPDPNKTYCQPNTTPASGIDITANLTPDQSAWVGGAMVVWHNDANVKLQQPAPAAEKKSNTVYYVVGGVAVAALAGTLLYMGTRRRAA